ncbi:MAG: hypothetical protein WBO23_06450 [Burkholderiales bacterium]
MRRLITVGIPFALVLAASASGPPALAQGMPGKMDAGRTTGPGYEVTAEMQRYREMAGVMRDMSRQMNKMQESMATGEMLPERRKRMQQQLKEMSDVMSRMAGLADRPSMNDPDTRKQTGEMRKQVDDMMRMQP